MAPQIKIIRSHRRTISMQIGSDGGVIVKAPFLMLPFQINSFVKDHSEWIEKNVKLRKNANKLRNDGELLFLGKILMMSVGEYSSVSVEHDKLLFPEALIFRKDKELSSWYLSQAKRVITEQVEYFAQRMKTEYKEITFSDTKSQWGRCTHDNRLQFNWRLIMAPVIVINYVVIHELSHTFEKNHTQMFWMKVRGQNPSYRQQIKWLKENGSTLRI